MPDDVRAARVAYFNQLRAKQLLGQPLAPEEKEYLERVATMQAAKKLASGNVDSLMGVFLNGVRRGAALEALKHKYEMLLPNAPVPPPVVPGKPGVIMARPGEAVGIDESGRSIDIRGKQVANTSVPYVVTPYGDVPMRTGELRASDITSNPIQAYRYGSNNAFIEQALEAEFGEHLKAMEDNRDENGMPTDEFPADYFKGKSKREQQYIEWGVEALRKLRRGTRT
jgi:hypothetical protein